MKKLICILLTIFLVSLTACSNNKQEVSNASNLEDIVSYELEQLDKEQNLDNETLKSLSVIIRTNHILNNDLDNQNLHSSTKYKTIANQTKNETLKINGNLEFISISSNNYTWKKIIQKDKLLTYAFNNNISLSNLTSIEPIYNQNRVKIINIGGKEFDFKNLANEFDLESNKITNIQTNNKEIIIYGEDKGFNESFDVKKASTLSNEGKNYKEILENLYNNSTIS